MLKEENPNLKNTEISRLLGDLWRNTSEEEKRPYVEKEKEEREQYKIARAEWKKEFAAKKESERKAQQEQFMDPSGRNPFLDMVMTAPMYPQYPPHGALFGLVWRCCGSCKFVLL